MSTLHYHQHRTHCHLNHATPSSPRGSAASPILILAAGRCTSTSGRSPARGFAPSPAARGPSELVPHREWGGARLLVEGRAAGPRRRAGLDHLLLGLGASPRVASEGFEPVAPGHPQGAVIAAAGGHGSVFVLGGVRLLVSSRASRASGGLRSPAVYHVMGWSQKWGAWGAPARLLSSSRTSAPTAPSLLGVGVRLVARARVLLAWWR